MKVVFVFVFVFALVFAEPYVVSIFVLFWRLLSPVIKGKLHK